MRWWSWAIVGYVGLVGVYAAALVGACATMTVQARNARRRLIRDAERFLAEVDLSRATRMRPSP